MEDVVNESETHRMDEHMPAGVKNSSTFSCSYHNPPHDPETGSALEQEWEC